MPARRTLLIAALAVVTLTSPAAARITAPSGVSVDVVAADVGQPTNIAWDSGGRMWLTSGGNVPARTDGVWLVRNRRGVQVVKGLFTALGLAWVGDELLVSYRYPRSTATSRPTARVAAYSGLKGDRFTRRRIVLEGLPVGLHNADSIAAGPDGRVYMGIGSVGNDRVGPAPTSGAVVSFLPSGRDLRVEARGLRNPYGIAFLPGSTTLLVTENGRDDLGPSRPPDELNAFDTAAAGTPSFGFPRCNGTRGDCGGSVKPLTALPTHAAAGGVAVSPDWDGNGPTAFVAQNGSSFPDAPTGNDVQQVALSDDGLRARSARRRFASGFARFDPLGAGIGPDGALYVTLWSSSRVVRFAP